LRNVLLGRSLLLSCSSILEGVQLGLKGDILVLECRELVLRAVTWAMTCWTVGTFESAMVRVRASGLRAKSLREHCRGGFVLT
jgi:hypothetical protein